MIRKNLLACLFLYCLTSGSAIAQLGLSAQRCDIAKARAIEKCVPMQLGAVGMATCSEAVAQANTACQRKDLTIVIILEEAGQDLKKKRPPPAATSKSLDPTPSGVCPQGQSVLGQIDNNATICSGSLKVQVGAFKDFSNATNFVKKLQSNGILASLDPGVEGRLNKVFVSVGGGASFSEESVKKIAVKLDQEGIKYVITR